MRRAGSSATCTQAARSSPALKGPACGETTSRRHISRYERIPQNPLRAHSATSSPVWEINRSSVNCADGCSAALMPPDGLVRKSPLAEHRPHFADKAFHSRRGRERASGRRPTPSTSNVRNVRRGAAGKNRRCSRGFWAASERLGRGTRVLRSGAGGTALARSRVEECGVCETVFER
jgi:hypothetical protein